MTTATPAAGASATATNRYLSGNLAPVRDEVTVTDLEVTGTLPEHLDGRYLRNGPNPVTDPDPATYHWFLGTGMVHGLRLRGGRAEWYRNRYVRSAEVAATLGQAPSPGPVHAGFDFAANTHVVGHAGRTLALVEAGPRPYELTDDLDTVGPCDFDGTLPGGYTAHPKRDPATGELHAVSYFWGWGNRLQYSVLGTDGRIRRTVDVEVNGSPMVHETSLTEQHVVIYDLPVTFDVDKALAVVPRPLAGLARSVASRFVGRRRLPDRVVTRAHRTAARRGGGMGLPYSWDPRYPARVGIMRRDSDGSDVRWFEIEPCYVYHSLNAFDDGDRVVVDVVRHPRTFAIDPHGPLDSLPTLDRWTFDLGSGKVLDERLDDRPQEFPRVDERKLGRPHRYGYAAGVDADPRDPGTQLERTDIVVKHDLVNQASTVRRFDPGDSVGEVVFVPHGADAAESDGILLGFVHRAATDRSDLVVLDAETLETVATVHLPVRIPVGFHGSWIPTPG